MIRYLLFVFVLNCPIEGSKPNVTLHEFFNSTQYLSLTLAPKNEPWILIQTLHHNWDQNINECHLHLHSLDGKNKSLITRHLAAGFEPQWHDEWIAYMFENRSEEIDDEEQQHYIQIYSTKTQQTFSLALGKESIHAFTWSNTNTTLYFAARTSWIKKYEQAYKNHWKDTIVYRDNERGDTIYRVDFTNPDQVQIEAITNISLRVTELICSPDGKFLVFSTESRSQEIESLIDYEIYLLDVSNNSSSIPIQLTFNQVIEEDLKWFQNDTILFTADGEESVKGEYNQTQKRLYSINVINGQINRWADQFTGSITSFDLLNDGDQGIIILGHLNTEVHVYTQSSPTSPLIEQPGWNGTYEHLVSSSADNISTIAFIFSSIDTPQEVYFVNTIDHLSVACAVTNENALFTERNLPKGTSYRWLNKDDGTEIEGVLHYPPDQFQHKNLSLFVLIHGGPDDASLNTFRTDPVCAMIIATEGWLVLEPNYRGSIGYGDDFTRGILHEILSRPGRDILYGVDALIQDGIADPKKLALGGYSYGGFLTNWLITQTTRFNAALTGAGGVENVMDWGTNDIPFFNSYLLGGLPWQIPIRYQAEAAIFQLNKVRTPTHIVFGASDTRVPPTHGYLLERTLHSLGVPHKLIVFPNEGHDINRNPWHGMIKVREELKWLRKYGHICVSTCEETLL